MRAPVTPPLDLLDDEGGWFRFRTFADYVEELKRKPGGDQLRAARRPHHAARADHGRPRPARHARRRSAQMRAMVDEALAAGAIGVSTGLYYEPAQRRADRGGDRGLPAAHRSATASTARTCATRATTSSIRSRRRFRIGRELGVPVVISHHKVVGHAEPRPLGRDAGVHREGDALAADRPRLLSVQRLVDHPLVRAARRSRSKVLVTWSKPHPEFAGHGPRPTSPRRWAVTSDEAVEQLLPGRRDLLLAWTRRTCSASSPSSTP